MALLLMVSLGSGEVFIPAVSFVSDLQIFKPSELNVARSIELEVEIPFPEISNSGLGFF